MLTRSLGKASEPYELHVRSAPLFSAGRREDAFDTKGAEWDRNRTGRNSSDCRRTRRR